MTDTPQGSARGQAAGLPRFATVRIAGLPVHVASRAQTLDYVQEVIERGATCRHGFLNAGKVVMAHQDPRLFAALESCDLISPDGMSIVWASRFLGTPLPERVNGTNLMLALCGLAQQEGYRIYLLGARPQVVADAEQQFREDFPGLLIVGRHHGYFSRSEEPAIVEEIRRAKPDVVFVGISSPKKEFWLQRNVPLIGVPFSMGVGGSFDIVAGRKRRAPAWMQEAGLEWLWRFVQEPRKMWPRYLYGNPNFVWLVGRQWWRGIRKAREERGDEDSTASVGPADAWSKERTVERIEGVELEGGEPLEALEERSRKGRLQKEPERLDVLGVGVSAVNMRQTLDIVEGWIADREGHYVCATPAHGIMDCYGDPELRAIFNGSGLTVPDGMSLVYLLWLSGFRDVSRVYGPDLLLAFCRRSLSRGYRHYFYGGKRGVVEDLTEALSNMFPGLQVAGTHTPPFRALTEEEDREVVQQIREARPDIVWVGISTPKQERWMAEHLDLLDVPVLVGVGAAFDFVSGHKRQAPRWMQRIGLEWLFRLANEPRRLWPRYRQYPRFALLLLARLLAREDRQANTEDDRS